MDAHELASSAAGSSPRSGTVDRTSTNANTLPKLPISATRDNAIVNPMFKTEICRNFYSTGNCRFGDKCQFDHGNQELKKSNTMGQNTWKRRVCRFSRENCHYGQRCIFPHDDGPQTCGEMGVMPRKKYRSNIQSVGIDSRRSSNNRAMLNNCNDVHGQAELRRFAPNLASESTNVQIAPITSVKDAVPEHSQTPTSSVYNSRQKRSCLIKEKWNKKLVGIYADWIDDDSPFQLRDNRER